MARGWWHSEWLGGMAILVLLSATLRFDPLTGIEGWGYDLVTTLSAPANVDDRIVLVATDDVVAGSRAWGQGALRSLLERLAQAAPRAVALFGAPREVDYPPAVKSVAQEARQLLEQQDDPMSAPLLGQVAALTDGEQRLADAMRAIPILFLADEPAARWSPKWRWSQQRLLSPLPPEASASLTFAPLLAQAATTVASDTLMRDPSGVTRRVPLIYRQQNGTLAATLPLQLLAAQFGEAPTALRFRDGGGVVLGRHVIASDPGGYLYPHWPQGRLPVVTAQALLSGNPQALASLRDKIVIATPLNPAPDSLLRLADGRRLAAAEMDALTVAAVMNNAVVQLPWYARWVQLGTLLLVGMVLTLLMPRLASGIVVVSGVVMLLLLLNIPLLFFLLRGEWLPLVTPLLALVLGTLLLLLRRYLLRHVAQLRQRLGTVTLALAQQLRQQGQLDEAHYHLQQCAVAEACDELYQLGLAYERKRQFNLAEQVFSQIHGVQPRFRDVADRVRINREASARIVIPGHSAGALASTLVMDQSALQKPVVGRYRIERELGRGAMGMVYLGTDPKISRTVAIKTVMLDQEGDDKQSLQVRERFFREAESAGRLNHPHIVTIYDVGEEGDLAYIAMDYLEGVSLDHHTGKENLLAVDEVMKIIAQVADALNYAHSKGVVHRDIKPANIIYNREKGTATVTDFGVAHLSDASKTRTGTVLGSPYYMAPEQLAGARVDGRADLFSLGVTFYQLLTGSLPFEADSIATLMYKIANSRHVSVSKLRRGVPRCASRIINRLLHKEAEKRFQNGDELHRALLRCLS